MRRQRQQDGLWQATSAESVPLATSGVTFHAKLCRGWEKMVRGTSGGRERAFLSAGGQNGCGSGPEGGWDQQRPPFSILPSTPASSILDSSDLCLLYSWWKSEKPHRASWNVALGKRTNIPIYLEGLQTPPPLHWAKC